MSRDKYSPTIGIECHVQLKTATKLFAAVSNDAREAKPNTIVSPICFGLPGVLPYLNEQAVELAIRAGHVLNAEIAEVSVFDRKHYFYPDLPKGYQISQFHRPIVGKGYIEVPSGDKYQKIGITRAHLEEDAGKLVHTAGEGSSFVDLNRAGTPLLEIVSEPEMHSAAEAKAFAQELYNLMTYADVTDGDLYHGNMRFDVNISVAKKGSASLGLRAEIKNLNSFKSVERAVEFEIDRQIDLLEKDEKVVQETRGWDEAKQRTVSQRSKEDAHDYRYFPDPDIPPVVLNKDQINEQKKLLPTMPKERRQKFNSLELDGSQIETLVLRKHLGDILLEIVSKKPEFGKKAANLLTGAIAAELIKQEGKEDDHLLNSDRLLALVTMMEEDQLNSNAADRVAVTMIKSMDSPAEIASDKNLIQVSDETKLKAAVEKVIKANQQAADDVKNGEAKAIGYLVGQVMKETKGKANPQMVQKLIREVLK